ncbi:MAG TPA: G1 family glutamic endopeptidase, partial [Thermomicrobiaceae bacterium]|nr:G1 family glutamic endopeptidase [Thermomicrobiaceae bacterium]
MYTKLMDILAHVGFWRRIGRGRVPMLTLAAVLALSLAACGPLITRTTRVQPTMTSTTTTSAASTSTKTPASTSAASTAAATPTPTSGSASLASAQSTPTPSGPKPTAAQIAAIKSVIEKGNQEQARALATNNPSLMQDTSTSSYYAQMVQTQQSLQNSGVASIQLTKLTWGDISLTNATTAKATDIETWNTVFTDGSTLQQANTNVYTLVLQNGAWKVEDDEQPNTSSNGSNPSNPSNPSANPTPVAPVSPASPGSIGQSANWAGYAASGSDFTSVSASWKVPTVKDTTTTGASASWVGIGGVSSTDLIQAGTEVTVEDGQATYDAWYELLPDAQQIIPLSVQAGDQISVSIHQQASGKWQIVIKDETSSQTYQTSVSYTSTLSSAEWIEEAPAVGQNLVLPLDNFGSVTFSGASTVENGKTRTISQAGAQSITMENQLGQALAQPSK